MRHLARTARRMVPLSLILLGIATTATGCLVAPVGPPIVYAPRPVVMAPAPIVVAPPAYAYGWGWHRRYWW